MATTRSHSQTPQSRFASLSAAHKTVADVNGDHRVTSLDALMIAQAAAGIIDL